MTTIQRRLTTLTLFAGLAASLAGCGGNPLVGKWAGTMSTKTPMGALSANVLTEFKADGTETQTVSVMGQTMTIQSTYKTEDNKLIQTVVSTSSPLMKIPKEAKTIDYKLDGDTLTLEIPNMPAAVVLTRQK